MELAVAFIRAGELTDALDALDEQVANEPDDVDARRTRAEVLLRLGGAAHWEKALADIEAVGTPTAADHYMRSVLLGRLGRTEAARDAAQAAVDAAADDVFRGKAAARLLDLTQQLGDAAGALEIAREHDWAGRAAEAALALGDAAAAYEYYTEALARAEKLEGTIADEIAANIRARVRLGRAGAALRAGMLDEAEADYAAAGAVIPDDPMIPFNRGEIALRRGDTAAATTLLRQAYKGANEHLRGLMRTAARANEALRAAWEAATNEAS